MTLSGSLGSEFLWFLKATENHSTYHKWPMSHTLDTPGWNIWCKSARWHTNASESKNDITAVNIFSKFFSPVLMFRLQWTKICFQGKFIAFYWIFLLTVSFIPTISDQVKRLKPSIWPALQKHKISFGLASSANIWACLKWEKTNLN